MTAPLVFFYDVASPYSYLTFARIHDVAPRYQVSVDLCPFLLGGVFRATSNVMPAANPVRAKYLRRDLERCALRDDIPFHFSSSFPHNSLHAMRAITAAPSDIRLEVSRRIFKAAWVEDLNISTPEVCSEALGEYAFLLEEGQAPEVKERLKEETARAVDAGAFGAPFFLVDEEAYWGNDRLEMALEYARTR